MGRKKRKKYPTWFWLVLCGALLALGLVGGVVYCRLAVLACDPFTFDDPDRVPHRKVGLVLGCSRRVANGRENPFFKYRIEAAANLFRAGKVDYLLVSGDNRRLNYNEPLDMGQALVSAGIPPQRIVRDYAGFTTLDSVLRARHVFQESRFTIISQRFHTQRAVYIARGYGIDAIGFNAGEVSVSWAPKVYVREVFARVRAVLDVNLLGRQPHFLGTPVLIGGGKAPPESAVKLK